MHLFSEIMPYMKMGNATARPVITKRAARIIAMILTAFFLISLFFILLANCIVTSNHNICFFAEYRKTSAVSTSRDKAVGVY